MNDLPQLIRNVKQARTEFIATASGLSPAQAAFKSSAEVWSVVDNVEHMVWAEMRGVNGIWKTLEGIKNKKPIWTGEAIHHGLSIEVIVEKTWQPKEIVPEIAKPRWGGPVEYWIASLQNCQILLEALGEKLAGHDLEQIIYPHIISGPLNVIQRMEFLRFHLNRHQRQIENIKAHVNFPKL
jgi:DinB superfamily